MAVILSAEEGKTVAFPVFVSIRNSTLLIIFLSVASLTFSDSNRWRYSERTDPLTDEVSRWLLLESIEHNTGQYQTPILGIGHNENGMWAYVQYSDFINIGEDPASVVYRLGSGPQVKSRWRVGGDSSIVYWPESTANFLQLLTQVDQFVIAVDKYDRSRRYLAVFKVSGLKDMIEQYPNYFK